MRNFSIPCFKRNKKKGNEQEEPPLPVHSAYNPSSSSSTLENRDVPQLEGSYTTETHFVNIGTSENLSSSERSDSMLKNVVRIMVVGRSGSGKSTIIRLVMGEKGPTTMITGPGQNLKSVEWHYSNPDHPLIFHDTNGMDAFGASRLKEIKQFLHEHQNSPDITQKIDVVWYVFSAADTRFVDDGGLLEMLNDYLDLPIMFVMTFNDHERFVKKNVDSSFGLDKLLERISIPDKRQRVRDMMVRIGNDVEQLDDGSLTGQPDDVGLESLIKHTMALIGKDLHAPGIVCQDTQVNDSPDVLVSGSNEDADLDVQNTETHENFSTFEKPDRNNTKAHENSSTIENLHVPVEGSNRDAVNFDRGKNIKPHENLSTFRKGDFLEEGSSSDIAHLDGDNTQTHQKLDSLLEGSDRDDAYLDGKNTEIHENLRTLGKVDVMMERSDDDANLEYEKNTKTHEIFSTFRKSDVVVEGPSREDVELDENNTEAHENLSTTENLHAPVEGSNRDQKAHWIRSDGHVLNPNSNFI